MKAPPSKQLDQFVVRLPDGMRERIRLAAEVNRRSMNAEIIARLEATFLDDDQPPIKVRWKLEGSYEQDLHQVLSEMRKQMKALEKIAESDLRDYVPERDDK